VPVDVRAVLDACVAVAESDLLPRARVVRDYADVPLVSASESRLGQVFLNLIVNAAQSIAPGAADANAITLRVATGADGAVEVRVDDTGSGIAAEHLPRLFEPFFTTKPADVGTGLGLWICADIVQRLGGTIAAQSDGVRGASFVVSLPADATVARPEPVSPPPPRAIPGGRRPRVLVVDDEEALARIVASVLSDEFDVVVEGGGRAALTLLDRDAAFDAVLCDLAMPDLSGADVFTTLEERAPRLAERVVFATGGAYSAASRAILDRAPNPTVDKPFELESLRAVLRKVASRAEADRSR
jgi:CheY-like chemotaxis protein